MFCWRFFFLFGEIRCWICEIRCCIRTDRWIRGYGCWIRVGVSSIPHALIRGFPGCYAWVFWICRYYMMWLSRSSPWLPGSPTPNPDERGFQGIRWLAWVILGLQESRGLVVTAIAFWWAGGLVDKRFLPSVTALLHIEALKPPDKFGNESILGASKTPRNMGMWRNDFWPLPWFSPANEVKAVLFICFCLLY
jgi:hypothetical protein